MIIEASVVVVSIAALLITYIGISFVLAIKREN